MEVLEKQVLALTAKEARLLEAETAPLWLLPLLAFIVMV
jgi:hypothetical protein